MWSGVVPLPPPPLWPNVFGHVLQSANVEHVRSTLQAQSLLRSPQAVWRSCAGHLIRV